MMIRKILFCVLFYLGIHHLFRFQKAKNVVTVLCFHRVNDFIDQAWPPLKTKVFESVLLYLKKYYCITTFDNLESDRKNNKPLVILTFDDGYLDFMQNALPFMIRYNIPSNMNVVVNSLETGELIWTQRLNNILNQLWEKKQITSIRINNVDISIDPFSSTITTTKKKIQNQLYNLPYYNIIELIDAIEIQYSITMPENIMMTWEHLQYCQQNNVEIGSQTITHRPLKNEFENYILVNEIERSKKIIEDKISRPVNIFAFPNGLKNDKAVQVAYNSGYKYVLEVREKFYKYVKTDGNNCIVIPRVSIYHNDFYESVFNIEGLHTKMRFR